MKKRRTRKICIRLLFLLLLLSLLLLWLSPSWMPEALKPAASAVRQAVGAIREWISPTPEAPALQYEVIRVIDGVVERRHDPEIGLNLFRFL